MEPHPKPPPSPPHPPPLPPPAPSPSLPAPSPPDAASLGPMLTPGKCDALFSMPGGRFRKIWGADGWRVRSPICPRAGSTMARSSSVMLKQARPAAGIGTKVTKAILEVYTAGQPGIGLNRTLQSLRLQFLVLMSQSTGCAATEIWAAGSTRRRACVRTKYSGFSGPPS